GLITFGGRPGARLRGTLELVRLDAATGQVAGRTELESASGGDVTWFDQPRVTPDGRRLLIVYGSFEHFIADAAEGKVLHRYPRLLNPSALTPDGARVIGAGLDDVRAYEVATG